MLNKQQQKVVDSTSPKLLCLAGAGTGKTHTMISKIVHYVEDLDVSPSSILCLTFTNAAASEMEARYLSQTTDVGSPYFGTFHKFCYSLIIQDEFIRRHLGYNSVPQVCSESQERLLCDKAQMLASTKLSRKAQALNYKPKPKERFEYRVFQKKLDWLLKTEALITFDRLCYRVCELFEQEHPLILQYLSKYRYVFVDEFQDTDLLQWKFVKSFLKNSHVCVVGDVRQNLYSFRGSTSDIIKQLSKDGGWETIKLEQNYRSSIEICDYANHIVKGYQDDIDDIELTSDHHGPKLRHAKTQVFDANIKTVLDDDCESIAIIARTNREVDHIKNICLQEKIPFTTKLHNNLEGLIASALNEEFYHSYLLSHLPRDIRTETLRNLYLDPNYDIMPTCLKHRSDIIEEVEAIRESDNLSEIEQILDSGGMTLHEIAESSMLQLATDDVRLYLGTIHSVKGLEFDSVYVYDVGGKHFKIYNEDMRNLYYVACTRAKSLLTIVSDT